PRRNFFMSSGPSRARVMELERLVNSILPRRSRNVQMPSADDVDLRQTTGIDNLESNEPCFCPAFAPCVGKCHRAFRYW
ncbi:hypothetical protein GCK32_022751, partial [Trichostrongylus colubriformis]